MLCPMDDSSPVNAKGCLCLVEWVDTYGCSTHWTALDDAHPELMRCKSVGWIVAETAEAITVVPHKADGESGQGCGDMTIPIVAVTQITDLVYGGRTLYKATSS